MLLTFRQRVLRIGFAAATLTVGTTLYSQPKPATPVINAQDARPADAGPETVQIKREAMKLIDPKAYHVALQLEPIEGLSLSSPTDAVVSTIQVQPGSKVESQAEIIRLDKTEQELLAEKAKAEYRAANVELRKAKAGKDADTIELAEAKLAASDAALKLAQYRLDRISVRTPMSAQVFRVHVVPGQVVRAGEPLATIGNTKVLKVEIPVDRNATAAGKTLEIRIEDQTVQAKVQSILPLAPKFEPIRDLMESAASAVVLIENEKAAFSVGQTVYAPLVPRHPVSEVPNSAVANSGDGGRKVQVVRDGVIRDIPVQVLGKVGAERVFVSGTFAEKDELISSASKELFDGTRVRLMNEAPAGSAPAGTPPGTPANAVRRPS